MSSDSENLNLSSGCAEKCVRSHRPSKSSSKYPIVGDESIMSKKAHGTTEKAPMKPLRWSVDYSTADKICCFNRHFAEHNGYFTEVKAFLAAVAGASESAPISFYDPVSGKKLFTAPVGRSSKKFLQESEDHGWPSFRDNEVDWDNVRVLKDGETVSVDGVHLGHNIPDGKGNRYCINLVSVSGNPLSDSTAKPAKTSTSATKSSSSSAKE